MIERARNEEVMVYGIGMRSRGNRPMQPPGVGPGALQAMLVADLPDPGLARIVQDTGGGYTEIRFGQDLAAAFAHVADELHSQCLPRARRTCFTRGDVGLGTRLGRAQGSVESVTLTAA